MAEQDSDPANWQLSDQAKREIARRWSKLPINALEDATRYFRIQMSIQEEGGDAEWDEEMARLARTSRAFLDELERAKWTRYSFGQLKFAGRQFWLHELATKILRVFARIALGNDASGHQEDRRNRRGPRANLILAVRRQLEAVGYGTTARSNDDLVRILELLFCEMGYPVSDPRKTVAHVLEAAGSD